MDVEIYTPYHIEAVLRGKRKRETITVLKKQFFSIPEADSSEKVLKISDYVREHEHNYYNINGELFKNNVRFGIEDFQSSIQKIEDFHKEKLDTYSIYGHIVFRDGLFNIDNSESLIHVKDKIILYDDMDMFVKNIISSDEDAMYRKQQENIKNNACILNGEMHNRCHIPFISAEEYNKVKKFTISPLEHNMKLDTISPLFIHNKRDCYPVFQWEKTIDAFINKEFVLSDEINRQYQNFNEEVTKQYLNSYNFNYDVELLNPEFLQNVFIERNVVGKIASMALDGILYDISKRRKDLKPECIELVNEFKSISKNPTEDELNYKKTLLEQIILMIPMKYSRHLLTPYEQIDILQQKMNDITKPMMDTGPYKVRFTNDDIDHYSMKTITMRPAG